MNVVRCLILFMCLSGLTAATAQWGWRDNAGSVVYSDRPPPPDVPAKDIVKRPAGVKPDTVTAELPPSQPEAAASAPRPAASTSDAKNAPKPTTEKQAEEQRKKAEADKLAKARAENCARAVQAKNTYESGVRLARANTQGERVFMDEATRTAELKRIQSVIATDCQ